jgi:hypothetical protein
MKIDNRDIFEQIGNLFYAIAAEQKVKPLEGAELKFLISEDWLPRNFEETKGVVSDETHFILTAMDNLEGAQTPPREAFSQFVKFYELHPEVFTAELTQRILNTATQITRIFEADNTADNTGLIALKRLVNKVNINL